MAGSKWADQSQNEPEALVAQYKTSMAQLGNCCKTALASSRTWRLHSIGMKDSDQERLLTLDVNMS